MTIGGYYPERRSPRVYKPLPISVWDELCEKGSRLSGAIIDLSDHGFKVATKSPLRQGQTVVVVLNDSGMCFRRCRVVWTRPKQVPQFSQAGLEVLR